MQSDITALVLAAGKGTRMKSARAKVLHEVFFRPMILHVLDAVRAAGIERCAVIVGHQRQEVLAALAGCRIQPVIQEEQLGTGHAVLCAESACADSGQVMILCGDTPLIRGETLTAMIRLHRQRQADLTLMTTLLDQPFGYGRILDDGQGGVLGIVEEKDADAEQKLIREINAGIYLVDRAFLFSALSRVGTDNSQGEVYLTDIVAIAAHLGKIVQKFVHPEALDVLGVNSRVELAQAQSILQARRNRELMLSGVTLLDPAGTLISPDAAIGQDTIIEGRVRISGRTDIGRNCRIECGSVLENCRLGEGVWVGANSVLFGCELAEGSRIDPLTLRRGLPA